MDGKHTPGPGDILIVFDQAWQLGPSRVRLVRRYEHPAENGWFVNVYDSRRRRFSKVEQAVDDAAIAEAEGGAA